MYVYIYKVLNENRKLLILFISLQFTKVNGNIQWYIVHVYAGLDRISWFNFHPISSGFSS